MKILFDVAYLYYLPHFTPVIEKLISKNVDVGVIFYQPPPPAIEQYFATMKVTVFIISDLDAVTFYQQQAPDWVLFGHASEIAEPLNTFTKTALILHGLGPKSTYYNASSKAIQYRFVESEERCQKLKQLYPAKTFVTTGYTKLDPIINRQVEPIDLLSVGLDPSKKTILYSPTFYPSTIENFPKNWPQQFSNYNILLKPHYLSLVKSSYKQQRKLLQHWNTFDNVYLAKLEEQSLLPFMTSADIMISETSSALFEFMALNKPVIICHFLKLRWGYRGLLKFRLKQRLSDDYKLFQKIGSNINHYNQLGNAIQDNLEQPQLFESQRRFFSQQIVGTIDGQCSQRVVDYLLENARCE